MKQKVTKEHINLITKDLFNITGKEDTLFFEGKDIIHKGTKLTQAQRVAIISEAQQLKVFPLWALLKDELKYLASEKIYLDSKTEEDILFGKCILWTIDVLEKKIDRLSKLG